MSKKSNQFSPEVRERAVRMMQEHRSECPSLWAAIESIAPKMDGGPQALNEWVKRTELDSGTRAGVTTSDLQRLKELECENRELRYANEILKPANAIPSSATHAPTVTSPWCRNIERVWQTNMRVYGVDKVWKQINREGFCVARCTDERLRKRLGLQGVRRSKVVRTTIGDMKAPCPLDQVHRVFKALRSNQLRVSDFT